MVRHLAAINLQRVLTSVFQKVPITFPEEFGEPQFVQTATGFLAAFPSYVQMQLNLDGKPAYCRAVGEGPTPEQTLVSLFREYAAVGGYEAVALRDRGSAYEEIYFRLNQPYGTVFRPLGIFSV